MLNMPRDCEERRQNGRDAEGGEPVVQGYIGSSNSSRTPMLCSMTGLSGTNPSCMKKRNDSNTSMAAMCNPDKGAFKAMPRNHLD